jgi:hypothetical protein
MRGGGEQQHREVSANFADGGCRQRKGSPQRYFRLSRPEPLLFLPSTSSIVLTRQSGPHSRPNYFSENLVAPRIETRPCGSVARNSGY